MSRSIYKSLLENLRVNDIEYFWIILEIQGLPQDDNYYDYDLLMRALRLNRKRFVKLLLDKKCRVNKPRQFKVETNTEKDMSDYLSKKQHRVEVNKKVTTPLHLAVKKLGWCNIVGKMLKLKARVSDVNADGNTPLHLAFISKASDRVIKLLLKHYFEESTLNICNKDGLSLLHIACMKTNADSVRKFFDVGFSDIWTQVSSLSDSIYAGYSVLHFAVEAGNHKVANFLCQYEADIYAQDRNMSTPLHLALEKRDTKMIDILCYYDCKTENYVDHCGLSHFMAAIASTDLSIVENYISIAEDAQNSSLDKMLTGRVKDIPDYPLAGYSVLHFACEYGRSEIVQRQLASDIHFSLTMQKLTPLDLARKNNHKDICDMLQKHCDDCESCNDLILSNVMTDVFVDKRSIFETKNIMRLLLVPSIFFVETFTLTNFLRFAQMSITILTNFTTGAKKIVQIFQTQKNSQSMGRRMSLLFGTKILCMLLNVY